MTQKSERGRLPDRRPRRFEDLLTPRRNLAFAGEIADGGAQRLEIHLVGSQRQARAVRLHGVEASGVDVDRDHRGAHRRGDLHAETAHTANADEYREIAVAESAAPDRLVRSRNRIGDDGERCEVEPGRVGRRVVEIGDGAESVRGNANVRGKAAVHVASEKYLVGTDRTVTVATRGACSARDHGRHDDATPRPFGGAGTGFDHDAADFVAERQREGVARGNAVVEIAEVGVTDAATGDFDEHLSVGQDLVAGLPGHRFARAVGDPAADSHARLPVGMVAAHRVGTA